MNESEAIAYFEAKLRVAPYNFRLHRNLAPLVLARGEVNRALRHYRSAIDLNPADADSRNDLAALLFSLGKWQPALAALKQVWEKCLHQLRQLCFKAARLKTSHEQRTYSCDIKKRMNFPCQVLELNPSHAQAHANLTALYFSRGDIGLARRHAHEAAAFRPLDPAAHRNLARVLDATGNTPEAIRSNKVAIRRGPGAAAA
ncbi:unnamed protein product, partial [Phaeothamnion confervicola]